MDEPSGRYAYYGSSHDIKWPVDARVDARYAHQCCEHKEPPSPFMVRVPDGHCERKEPCGVRRWKRCAGFIDEWRDAVHNERPRVIIEKLDDSRDDAARKND